MRVMTWNIELGRDIEQAAEAIREQSELACSDVIFAQEMNPASTHQLAQDLGMYSQFAAMAAHRKTGEPFGNAILSRQPVCDPRHLALPHVARVTGQPRSALFAKTWASDTSVLVGSMHTETPLLSLPNRVRQLCSIADFLDEEPGPCVIGGDFNTASTRSRDAFERTLSRSGVVRLSAIDTPTLRRFRRPFVLDHIFGRGLTVVAAGVASVPSVSDHDPAWVELSLDITPDPLPGNRQGS